MGLALLLFLPALLWQVRNHFPLLTDMENIRREGKNVVLGPLAFVKQQIEFLDPLLLPVWLAGLVALFRRREARVLGWFYLLLLGAMILLHGKNYYLAAVYPMLFAAGAVALEAALDRWNWSRAKAWPKAVPFAGVAAAEPANLICLGCSREGLEGHFDSVTEVAVHHSPWGMAEENRPIYLGRGLRTPLHAIWPRIIHWN